MMLANNPLFRPPAEANSLILQVDRGCPHNRCTFCGMYRDTTYRRRPMEEVRALIAHEGRRDRRARRVFLADGDVMRRPASELLDMLSLLGEELPRLTRISLYANGRSISSKPAHELEALRAAKLHTLYMGLESGDETILRHCRKGETADGMVKAGIAAQAAGLRMSVMVLLGLGGVEQSTRHVEGTVAALNRMQPRLLSALRVVPVDGTELHEDFVHGRFRQLSEAGVVRELRQLIAGLELTGTVFRANHASNVVPLEARLPHDKDRVLSELDGLLASGVLDDQTPGRLPLWL
jgi:radical SAM superfamily enzyme YgiQ (UPF0313 family)